MRYENTPVDPLEVSSEIPTTKEKIEFKTTAIIGGGSAQDFAELIKDLRKTHQITIEVSNVKEVAGLVKQVQCDLLLTGDPRLVASAVKSLQAFSNHISEGISNLFKPKQ